MRKHPGLEYILEDALFFLILKCLYLLRMVNFSYDPEKTIIQFTFYIQTKLALWGTIFPVQKQTISFLLNYTVFIFCIIYYTLPESGRRQKINKQINKPFLSSGKTFTRRSIFLWYEGTGTMGNVVLITSAFWYEKWRLLIISILADFNINILKIFLFTAIKDNIIKIN